MPLRLEAVEVALVPRQVGLVPVDRVASVLVDLAAILGDLGLEGLVEVLAALVDLDLGVLVEVQVAHLVDSGLGVLVEVLAALVNLDLGDLVVVQAEVVLLVVLGLEAARAPQLLEEEGTVLAGLLGQIPEVLREEADFLTRTVP